MDKKDIIKCIVEAMEDSLTKLGGDKVLALYYGGKANGLALALHFLGYYSVDDLHKMIDKTLGREVK